MAIRSCIYNSYSKKTRVKTRQRDRTSDKFKTFGQTKKIWTYSYKIMK